MTSADGKYPRLPHAVLAAVFVRLLVLALAFVKTHDYSVFHTLDTSSYVAPAAELLSHGEFSVHSIPEISRTPGYAVFLLPGIALGGVELVTVLLQVFASCLTVYFVYRLAHLISSNRKVAVAAAFLYAIEPLSILYTVKLMTEALFTLLIVMWLYYLLSFLNTRSMRHILIASVVLAAATYVRPITYFLPVYTAVVLVVLLVRAGPWRRTMLHCAVFLTVSMGATMLWRVRNTFRTGYTGFSTIATYNLYFYDAAAVLSSRQGIPFEEMQRQMGAFEEEQYFLSHPDQRRYSRSGRFQSMQDEAVKIILGAPVAFGINRIKGTLRVLLNPGGAEYMTLFDVYPGAKTLTSVGGGIASAVLLLAKDRPLLFWTNIGLGLVLAASYFLAALSAVSRRYPLSPAVIVLLSVVVYFLLVSGGPTGTSRFRHPLMPMVSIFAGYGLVFVSDWWRKRRTARDVHG